MPGPDRAREGLAMRRRATAARAVLARLRSLADPAKVAGMARYGIHSAGTLGVQIAELRPMARELRSGSREERHALALALWDSGVHEARILAAMVDDPALVTDAQAERWAGDLDSWDVCDQLCANLLDRTPLAWRKARAWSEREEPFVKRAGFALMARLAVHDRRARDADFVPLLGLAESEAGDDRNYVKKAVSWALRQIGKRSPGLRRRAMAVARRVARQSSRSARWIASDVLRELDRAAPGRARSRGGRGGQPRTRAAIRPSGATA
jgi:3-methyladenine DNA glycosylase AlkD